MTQRLSILSPRLIQCLSILADHPDFVTVAKLAETCKTSKRTLFREMKDINELIRPYHVALQSKTGFGVKMEGGADEKQHFKSLLLQAGAQCSLILKEERQAYLMTELLRNKSLQKLVVYSHKFDVSEATISNDVKAIEPILTSYGLQFVRHPGSQMTLIGDEGDFRKAITDYFHKHIDEESLRRMLETEDRPWMVEDYFRNQGPDSILQLVNKEILWNVIKVLKKNDSIWIHRLAQSSYIGLILHITIALERMKNNDEIKMNPVLLRQIQEDPYYQQATHLASFFEAEFNRVFPQEEIAYITLHLKGARLLHVDASVEDTGDEELISAYEVTRLVYRLVEAFELIADLHIKQDELLIAGLTTHLRPALIRIKFNMEIRNPLLKQIQSQYAQVYKMTFEAVAQVSKEYGLNINQDEIGFLAIHFGAALERRNHKELRRTVRLAVICASGIGISSLLASKIKRIFQDDVKVEPRSQVDVLTMTPANYDLLVTTMPIELSTLPVLMVNPLLSEKDVEALRFEIGKLSHSSLMFSQAQKHAKLTSILDQMECIAGNVKHLLENVDAVVLDPTIPMEKIISMIGYRIGKDKKSGKLIVEDLREREKMGSIQLDEEQVILLHAKTSGVTAPICMVFRSNSSSFIDPALSGMKCIVVLLVPSHVDPIIQEMMSRISAGLLEDPTFLYAIHRAETQDLREAVENILKPGLDQWLKEVADK
ncbi:MAG: transcription antiterminator [Erysipelotrichaceae bacterium]